jgi:hypothetical protein
VSNTTRCHVCGSHMIICTDVFDRGYCYEHAKAWIEHIGAVVGIGDVSRWCEHGGIACPAAEIAGVVGEQDAAAHEEQQ